ncbi:EFC12 protein, partial [Balaeniceps rex]|nr:EFC12 protein [Balaeniceps rex]
HLSVLQLPQEEEDSLSSPETTSDTEEGLQKAEAWVQARRQFRKELDSLGDIEKWLAHKPSLSAQERRCWQRIKARRADRAAAVKSAVTDSLDVSTESSQPWKKGGIPLVCAPYPQALVTLHSLLHKQKLRMVDVFRKAGMDGRKIKRADFIKVIKETKVPISDKDLEDVVIFLTSSKPGNFVSLEDVSDCQKQWLEMRKGQSQETSTAHFQKAATCPPSAGDAAKWMKPHAPPKPERKLIHLEVPPINTEPERRHLTYDEMEEIGKLSRERRRWEKNKDSPIERKEKCRMVRSGDGPVDDHCLPSTVGADLGQLVDRYRSNAVMSYLKSSELCKERNVLITEPTLQKGLLHPGDMIIREGEDIRKIRQPGGYYSTGRADAPSPGSTSRSGTASGSQAKEAENRFVQRGLEISPLLLPRCRNKMQKSSDNNFWPGHLLDKLCLYFPEKQHDRAHALFSYVHPTKPAYHGI